MGMHRIRQRLIISAPFGELETTMRTTEEQLEAIERLFTTSWSVAHDMNCGMTWRGIRDEISGIQSCLIAIEADEEYRSGWQALWAVAEQHRQDAPTKYYIEK